MDDSKGPRRGLRRPVILPVGSRSSPVQSEDRRYLIGIQVGTGCSEATGVLSVVAGHGLTAQIELVGTETVEVPPAEQRCYQRLLAGEPNAPGEPGTLARELAKVQLHIIRQLLSGSSIPSSDVLAVGVRDPGLWHVVRGSPTGYIGLCDAAWLAERSGHNVLDAFPARDLAGGGQGGPIDALPYWMLLRDPMKTRALLDIGRTVRLTYLPAEHAQLGVQGLRSFDVGPGTFLLDSLASQLSEGRITFDPGGRLAVQGRRIPDLIEHWLADPYFQQPLPRWHPLGVRPDDELDETVRMAIETGWSIRDLLCTATHFIAECIARGVADHLPPGARIDEILITGGGQSNGMLLGELAARLPATPLKPTSNLGLPGTLLDASLVAVLTMLHIDRIPANHPAITGTEFPAVLGRLTPGAPAAWQRLISHMHSTESAATSLRDVV